MSDPGARDLEQFLARPLVARLATNGPTVRPVWFLWEDGAFWWITGTYARLPARLAADPEVALVIDTCELKSGTVLQVLATGAAEVVAMDPERATRKLIWSAPLSSAQGRVALDTERRGWSEAYGPDGAG